jgi:hypothetical protein
VIARRDGAGTSVRVQQRVADMAGVQSVEVQGERQQEAIGREKSASQQRDWIRRLQK